MDIYEVTTLVGRLIVLVGRCDAQPVVVIFQMNSELDTAARQSRDE